MAKPKVKKQVNGLEFLIEVDSVKFDQLTRMVRGIQKLAADIDPDFAIQLGREYESKRRVKRSIAKMTEKG